MATACAPSGQGARWGDGLTPLYARPDRDEWPDVFHEQDAEVQAMYRYAVANREVLRWMPCFCGCVNGGHESNYDCFVDIIDRTGTVPRVSPDPMGFA